MSKNEIFLAVHIVGAITWVGGGTMSALIHGHVLKSGDETAVRGFTQQLSRLSFRYFMPASFATLISGVLAVASGGAEFDEPFVIGGFVLFGISTLIGMLILGPQSGKLVEAYEKGGFGGEEATARERLMSRANRADLLVLWAAVLVMVFRP